MRVFIVTQTFPPHTGGMENVMFSLAEKLSALGLPVTVLPKSPFHKSAAFDVVQFSVPKPLRHWLKRRYLRFHLQPDDIVICDSWKSFPGVPPHSGKCIVLAYGQEYLKSGRQIARIQKSLDRATHLIAISDYTMRLVKADWQIDHLKETIIAPTFMLPDDAPAYVPRHNKPLHIVSLCRLEARKGLKQSLEALAALQTLEGELPDWRWSLCGSGPQADELKNCIERLGLGDRVAMLGRVDEADKERLLAQADLFVMPSYQQGKSLEGYGITYVEAARFGVPAIAGVAGGAPEAVIDGKTGWCVDTLDATALQQTLSEALTQDDERQKRGAAARDHYVNNLTGSAVFTSFVNHIS